MSLCRSAITVFAVLLLNGCSSSELGEPCTLGFETGLAQAAYNPQAPECSSSLCLKPALSSGAFDRETAPYCTTTCSSDGDCQGQKRKSDDPDDHRCTNGYACGVAFAVGPLCCQKLCLCKDFISDRGVTTPPNCESGADGPNRCGVN